MTDEPVGELETVHTFDGPMPTGVTVSRAGRIFVNYPKWGDDVAFTTAELRDGQAVAFPDQATKPDTMSVAADGYLYVTANHLSRRARDHDGRDLRQKLYSLVRINLDIRPVALR